MTTGSLQKDRKLWLPFVELFLQPNGMCSQPRSTPKFADDDKWHPARWLVQLSQHYLGEEPIIQSTHNFLCVLKQEPGMSIQDWHTLVRSEYQKCNFPTTLDDHLQRDIFIIGLNDTFKPFRSDVIAREKLINTVIYTSNF